MTTEQYQDDGSGLNRLQVGLQDHKVVLAVASTRGYLPDEIIHFHAGNPLAREWVSSGNRGWQAEVHLDLCGLYLRGHATVDDPTEVGRLIAVQKAVASAFDMAKTLLPSSVYRTL